MKNIKILALLVIAIFILYSFKTFEQDKEWVVPQDYKTMENPYSGDKESVSYGKSLYMRHCKSCHGKEGLGDGPKASEQEGDLGDFSSEEFQAQTDGEILYKMEEGRDDMPSFKKKIPDSEDQWAVVNFVRTLKE
jgi:mono/diheme cytochrome c family protein